MRKIGPQHSKESREEPWRQKQSQCNRRKKCRKKLRKLKVGLLKAPTPSLDKPPTNIIQETKIIERWPKSGTKRGHFYRKPQAFRKEIMPALYKFLQRTGKKEIIFSSCYENNKPWYQKLGKQCYKERTSQAHLSERHRFWKSPPKY